VLLFDEPLSNLDARLRRSMREEIRALQQRLRLTVAYVTHDQNEALAVSDEIIVMDAGRVAQRGTPQALYERPASEFVAGFMGEAMLFDAHAHADGTVALGAIMLTPRQPVQTGAVRVAVRPEAWRVSLHAPGIEAVVQKSAYLGSVQELTLQSPLGSIFVVWPEPEPLLVPGQRVWLDLSGHGVSVVPG
jgi:iron(III) transport system ATP-binding protein